MNFPHHGKHSASSEVLFDTEGMKSRLSDIKIEMEIEGFWDNIDRAQKLLKEKKSLENKLTEFHELEGELSDIELLIEMAEEENDSELAAEIRRNYESFKEKAETLRLSTLLNEEYDSNNAIISIHPGSGGLDAQDWAEMLLRMYIRWAEKKNYKVKTLDFQRDTEGGIKNATLLIEGENAYGYLKTEKGVHRLVRISPFDTAKKRHTSFASLDVTPELDDDVKVEINPDDLRIDTYRSSGAGGQHVNKTDSAIRITHLPTNIVVSCQNERSQHQNKEYAMRMLAAKLYELAKQEHKEKIEELKGDYGQITWGNQIRSYVFHPYTMVKDHRTGAEVGNVQAVMDGDLDYFINASLDARKRENEA